MLQSFLSKETEFQSLGHWDMGGGKDMAVSRVTTKITVIDGELWAHAAGQWKLALSGRGEMRKCFPQSAVCIIQASMLTESRTMGNGHLQLALLHGIKDSEQMINMK